MDQDQAAQLAALIDFGYKLQALKRMFLAGYAALLFDWVITWGKEVTYIWSREWTYIKVLFLLNRYGGIASFALITWTTFAVNISPERCHKLRWMTLLGFAAPTFFFSNMLITARIYSICGRSRIVAVYMLSIAFGQLISWYFVGKNAISLPLPGVPTDVLRGCFATYPEGQNLPTAPVIIQNVFDLSCLFLTCYRGYLSFRLKGGLMQHLLKDGFLYFGIIFTTELIALIFIFTAAPSIKFILSYPSAAMLVTMSTRLTLSLRSFVAPTTNDTFTLKSISMLRVAKRSGFTNSTKVTTTDEETIY